MRNAMSTATPIFKSPEQSILEKLRGIQNTILDNKELIKRDEILAVFSNLYRAIDRLRAEHIGSRKINELNRLTPNYFHIVLETETTLSHYERIIGSIAQTEQKTPVEALLDVLCSQNTEKDPEEVRQDFFRKMNMLITQNDIAERDERQIFSILESYIGSDEEADQNNFPFHVQVNAVRAEIRKTIDAIYKIQDEAKQPHTCFGLKKAFRETKSECKDYIIAFLIMQDKKIELLKKITIFSGNSLPVSPTISENSSAPTSPTRFSGSFFSESESQSNSRNDNSDWDSELEAETASLNSR